MQQLFYLADLFGVAVFAITGALMAGRKSMDLFGVLVMAIVTALGGGTLRDLILNRDAIFWVGQPELILLTSGAAVLVFFTAHLFESRYRLIVWLDAFALSVAVPAGAGIALQAGVSPVVVVAMGVVTGTFGGLIRDVVGNELPMVLKQGELYVTAAFGGAVAAVVLIGVGMPRPVALIFCGLVVMALRAGSLLLGWSLPTYRARPPRADKNNR